MTEIVELIKINITLKINNENIQTPNKQQNIMKRSL